jgi:major membrane immunogen (membrane-anchored lipoprotein)
MKPYIVAALLACAFSLTACGKKDETPRASSSPQAAEKALTAGEFKPTESPKSF